MPTADRRRSPAAQASDGFVVVALAASVGGLRALREVLSRLPSGFGAAVVIVQHLDPHHRSHMADILGRSSALPVRQAAAGDRIAPGAIWIAPPNHHLLVGPGGDVTLTQTDRVHFLRPAADPMFESLARSFRERVIAVILTGSGSDGAAGVRAVKAGGGTVIVQSEATSDSRGMPRAAITTGCADAVLPLAEIGPALVTLIGGNAHVR